MKMNFPSLVLRVFMVTSSSYRLRFLSFHVSLSSVIYFESFNSRDQTLDSFTLCFTYNLDYFHSYCNNSGDILSLFMLGEVLSFFSQQEVAEDEMVRQHHLLNGHEFEQTLGYSEGQRSMVCYSPWGHKRVRDDLVTEQQEQQKVPSAIKFSNLLISLMTKINQNCFPNYIFTKNLIFLYQVLYDSMKKKIHQVSSRKWGLGCA